MKRIFFIYSELNVKQEKKFKIKLKEMHPIKDNKTKSLFFFAIVWS